MSKQNKLGVATLADSANQVLVDNITNLPPLLKEVIVKKCQLEQEESIYEKMYNELNEELSDIVLDKIDNFICHSSSPPKGDSYIDILAHKISQSICEKYGNKLRTRRKF